MDKVNCIGCGTLVVVVAVAIGLVWHQELVEQHKIDAGLVMPTYVEIPADSKLLGISVAFHGAVYSITESKDTYRVQFVGNVDGGGCGKLVIYKSKESAEKSMKPEHKEAANAH